MTADTHHVAIGLPFDAARTILTGVAAGQRRPAESLALARTHGRVLAQEVIAPVALPPFANSAMDGYAVRHCDLSAHGATTLRLVGEQFAGRSLQLSIGRGECVRITTGAPLPAGADTIVIRENTRADGDRVHVHAAAKPDAHVRHTGEDMRAGERLLQSGVVLTPARVGLVAALGIDQLQVARRPTVAVFTTGDELIEPGMPLRPGEIYNSNRELLMGLLRADGLEPTAWPTLPDDPAPMAAMLRDAASAFDVVLTCGAVSAGEKDHIPAWLQRHGRVHFWKVRMKPGMPLLFGQMDRALLLGLPGNPVSVLATYLTMGRALLDGLQGRSEPRTQWHARLSTAFDKRHPRREFLRGRLLPAEDGTLQVAPSPADGSHRLAAAAHCDVLVVLPEGERVFAAGAVVAVLPY